MARIYEILQLAKQKEAREKQEIEERHRRELERRKIIADGLEILLDATVRPSLDGCAEAVVSAGYHAEVVEIRKADHRAKDGSQRLIALQIKIAPRKDSTALTHALEFKGDFSEETVTCSTSDSTGPAVNHRPLPFSQLTGAIVSEKLERFLESAFDVNLH
jgi:hypothetical protein